MTGSILFCDTPPEVTERDGMFIVEMTSGTERISIALALRHLAIFGERATSAHVDFVTRRATVLPMPNERRKA